MISKLICWWKGCGLPGSLNVLETDHRERYKDALKFLGYNHWVSFSEWRGDLGGVVWVWLLSLLILVSFGVWVGLWVGTYYTLYTFHLLSVESRTGEIGWVGSCLGWGGCSWRGWLVASDFVSSLRLLIKIQFFLGFSRVPELMYMFIVQLLVICYWFWTIIATWPDGRLGNDCMGNLRNSLGVIRKEYAFGLIGMLNLLYHCVFLFLNFQKHTNLLGPTCECCFLLAKCLFSILFESVFGHFVWQWVLIEYGLKLNSCEKRDYWRWPRRQTYLLRKCDHGESWIQLDWLRRRISRLRRQPKRSSFNGLQRRISRLRRQPKRSSLNGLRRSFTMLWRHYKNMRIRRRSVKLRRQSVLGCKELRRKRYIRIWRSPKYKILSGLWGKNLLLWEHLNSLGLDGLWRRFEVSWWLLSFCGPLFFIKDIIWCGPFFVTKWAEYYIRIWAFRIYLMVLKWLKDVWAFIWIIKFRMSVWAWAFAGRTEYLIKGGYNLGLVSVNIWQRMFWARNLYSLVWCGPIVNFGDNTWAVKSYIAWSLIAYMWALKWKSVFNVVGPLFVINGCLVSQRPNRRVCITMKEVVWSGPIFITKWAVFCMKIWAIIVYRLILKGLKDIWALKWIIKFRMIVWTWALAGRTDCLMKYDYNLGLLFDNLWQRLTWARILYCLDWCEPIEKLVDSKWAVNSKNIWRLFAYIWAVDWKAMFCLDEWIWTYDHWVWDAKECITKVGLDGRPNCLICSWAWFYSIIQWFGLIGITDHLLKHWIWAVYKSFCIWVGCWCDRYYGPAYFSHLFRAHLFCHVGFYHFHFRICYFFFGVSFFLGLISREC
jgi:hypothetical protein